MSDLIRLGQVLDIWAESDDAWAEQILGRTNLAEQQMWSRAGVRVKQSRPGFIRADDRANQIATRSDRAVSEQMPSCLIYAEQIEFRWLFFIVRPNKSQLIRTIPQIDRTRI